jgi:hypothetical protein
MVYAHTHSVTLYKVLWEYLQTTVQSIYREVEGQIVFTLPASASETFPKGLGSMKSKFLIQGKKENRMQTINKFYFAKAQRHNYLN